jgi:hypothetical protein
VASNEASVSTTNAVAPRVELLNVDNRMKVFQMILNLKLLMLFYEWLNIYEIM